MISHVQKLGPRNRRDSNLAHQPIIASEIMVDKQITANSG